MGLLEYGSIDAALNETLTCWTETPVLHQDQKFENSKINGSSKF
jgi:hypothetical protein